MDVSPPNMKHCDLHFSTRMLAALVLAASPALAHPQTQLLERVHDMLPERGSFSAVFTTGDLDGDGDADMVVGSNIFHVEAFRRVYHNDGNGHFDEIPGAGVPLLVTNTSALHLGDLDLDGFLDLVEANAGGQNALLRNDGTGAFIDATFGLPADADTTTCAALFDYDGDADLDIVFGNFGQQNRLLANNGGLAFGDVTGLLPGDASSTIAIAVGDVDLDLDLDLLFGSIDFVPDPNQLAINTAGTFTFAPFPQPNGIETTAVALVDVDQDTDLDAIIGLRGQDELYLNDGTATFTPAAGALPLIASAQWTSQITAGDVDGDGDVDLALGGTDPTCLCTPTVLLLNDGAGVFATSSTFPDDIFPGFSESFVDVDGDGDLDFINNGSTLALNDGAGAFTLTDRWPGYGFQVGFLGVAIGDLDGDGAPDLVAVGPDNSSVRMNRDGSFEELVGALPLPPFYQGGAVDLGDVDQDGDLDALLSPATLLAGDGTGSFTDASTQLPTLPFLKTKDVALVDLDGDGDLDAMIADQNTPNWLLLNDGSGTYSDHSSALPPGVVNTEQLAFADVDADGDVDVLHANFYTPNRLDLNDGAGGFQIAIGLLPVDSDSTTDLDVGDVDADGDVDVVFANAPQQDRLYVNNGSGTFTDVTGTSLPVDQDITLGIALVDLDGDGNLDVYHANSFDCTFGVPGAFACTGGVNRLSLNDGAGVFTNSPLIPSEAEFSFRVETGDLDNDGDNDLVVVGTTGIQRNLTQHIAWRSLPRVGKPLELDVYGDANATWILVASANKADVFLPAFGHLGIDPTTLVAITGGFLSATGEASGSFAVPADPMLIDASIYWQGLVGTPQRFTNVERTTFANL